jgi:hypothetical protein
LHLNPTCKWIVISALIIITLSALVLASTSATVQENTDTKDKTEDLFLLLQKANATVAEIFCQFKAYAQVIPQASLNEYNQALLLAEESRNLLHLGKYFEAETYIIQALQKFKNALRIAYTTVPEQPNETEIALERAIQLKSSVNRYYEKLELIKNLTRFAVAAGFNTTALETRIQTVETLLDTASSNIDEKRFEAASANIADAKVLIGSLVNALNTIAADLKIQRLQTYIAQTEVRLATIKETAILLSNTASLTALKNAEVSLDNAKEYLEKQQINETLSELANSRASEEEAVEYLKPTASSLSPASSIPSNEVQVP